MDENNTIKSASVLEFLRVAHEYCAYTESMAGKPMNELLSFYQKLLPLLYLKGSLLPDIEPEYEDSFYERYVTEEHWENVFTETKLAFGKDEHFYNLDENGDTQKCSLAEFLADIYQDLKDFVILFQNHRNAAKESAVIEAKTNFIHHWGLRIADIIPILHRQNYQSQLANVHDEDFD